MGQDVVQGVGVSCDADAFTRTRTCQACRMQGVSNIAQLLCLALVATTSKRASVQERKHLIY